ncbi:hypothetical protein C5167_043729 [Papaver somniferum]|uniref:Uncharacterized protein n=1 Tax=Papaver somniferum TaxID=3469 RepID=A0A4Y7L9H8_PAPSO|nr:hypothetical protein C5167_043729 [Papaver somniferum]
MKARNGHGFDSELFESLLQLRMEAELQVLVAMIGANGIVQLQVEERELVTMFPWVEMGMLGWKNLMLEQRLQKKRSYKWWFEPECESLCAVKKTANGKQ